jgi:RHS repeat-associated protein
VIQSPADNKTYVYDDNGNLLLIQPNVGTATRYVYDGANRLRQVQSGELSIQYLYDIGARVLERIRTKNNSVQTERYWYSAAALLAVLDSAGDTQTVYTRADTGRLLRRRSKTPSNPQPSNDRHSLYYLFDGLRNVVRLVDADGHVYVTADYDSWGNAAVPNMLRGERFGCRAAFTDPDTSLLLFGRRWYDPALGRWLTQDPLLADALLRRRDITTAVMDVANLYVYVRDNPLNLTDPSGLGPGDSWIGAKVREVLAKIMLGRDVRWPEQQPKPKPVEKVEKESPDNNAEEADDDGIPNGAEEVVPRSRGWRVRRRRVPMGG